MKQAYDRSSRERTGTLSPGVPVRTLVLGVMLLLLAFTIAVSPARANEPGRVTGGMKYTIPAWFKTSFLELTDDAAEAAEADRHLMLFMHLDECPYCEAVLNESIVNSDYSPWLRERFDAIAINIRGDREVAFNEEVTLSEKKLAELLKVWQTPVVIFLDGENRQVTRIDGYRTPLEFERILHYVDDKAYLQMDLPSYVAKVSAGPHYRFRDHPAFTDETALSLNDKPLLVIFEDAWCGGCDLLHDTLLADPGVNEQLANYRVVRLDAESETPIVTPDGRQSTPRAWIRELGIDARPAILAFAEGRELVRIKGVLRNWHFTTAIRYVGEGHYKTYPTQRKFSRALRKQQLEAGIDVDLGRQ
ncbi:MAG: thioredoxin fold domain-containing protein [Sedimenticola sp.]|nr:thioredoxin fold domain-containing protein [Sedimenticola sp.]